jgi:general secretion pathway protein A
MYTDFYRLKEKPFALVPDPRYLFLSRSHREALAHLLYGIEAGEGFIVVIGQVGTGKTTLARTLLERIGENLELAFIFNPSSSAEELLAAINREFGIQSWGETRTELIEELNRFLLGRRAAGRRTLLVIDEAQNLEPEVLEQIRLLSNLETDREKLLQIVLFGQPELDENLSRPDLRQLRQRITIRWRLRPLSRAETASYAAHRLGVAGAGVEGTFSPGALRALYRASRGVPRLINAVADRALLAGYSAGLRPVDGRLVRDASRELPGVRGLRLAPWDLAARASALVAGGVLLGLLVNPLFTDLEAEPSALASVEGAPPASEPELPEEEIGLEMALRDRTPGATAADALNTVLSQWGYEPLGDGELLPEHFSSTLVERTGLLLLDTWFDLDRLKRLNLPAILEVEPEPGIRRYVAALRVQPDGTLVLRDKASAFPVSEERLERLWTGRTLLPWSNFESVPAMRRGMTGRAVEWLQGRLLGLGYLGPSFVSGEFDEETQDAVRQLQAEHSLDATGEVGPATLITIYQALRYGAPVLGAADSGGSLS